jgi:hypothetical protein
LQHHQPSNRRSDGQKRQPGKDQIVDAPTDSVSAKDLLGDTTGFDLPINSDTTTDSSLPMTAAPTITPPPGTHVYRTLIEMKHTDPNAILYFTMDGSNPTRSSLKYSAAIPLEPALEGIPIRVMAQVPGKAPSKVVEARYGLEKGIIVHFKPKTWTTPHLYYWETKPDSLKVTWPGVAMKSEGNGWYYTFIPKQTSSNVIFSENGADKTADLEVTVSEIWRHKGEWWDFNPDDYKRFAWPGGKFKALVVSMDDGNIQDLKFIDILNKNGIKGTFHLNSGLFGTTDRLTAAQIKANYGGHEIASHSLHHKCLKDLATRQEIVNEVRPDKQNLTQLAGYDVVGHAMAFGQACANDMVIDVLKSEGFLFARGGSTKDPFKLPSSYFLWRPCCHTSEYDVFKPFLSYTKKEIALLFLWGHAWEFDGGGNNNNWQYMEDLAKQLGNKSDIWYAGLTEVAYYTQAMRKVTLSPDKQTLHNTSQLSVWVKQGSLAVELKPGGTIDLF